MSSDINKLMNAWMQVQEKKLDPVGKEDGDIDNDGDIDSSDKYLKNRRKKIGQEMDKEESYGKKKGMKEEKKELPDFLKKKSDKDDDDDDDDDIDESKVECPKCKGKGCSHCDDKGYHMKEENIDELSTKTLTSYMGKASNAKNHKNLSTAKQDKRYSGVATASKKLDKKLSMKEKYKKTDKEMDEAAGVTSQHVKQGIGIARDKRYAGGNMTGAVNAMKKIHPNLHKHPKVAKELQKQNESAWKETLDTVTESPRVTKWTDFSEDYDEFKFKGKKRPQDRPLGKSDDAPTNDEYKKHTDGGSPPEGMFDKESEKSKAFIKLHQKSDPKWEDLEDEGHDDVSKAGRGVKTQSPNRSGRDHRDTGDKNVVNPITQKY